MPAYYSFRCTSCGESQERYRNVKVCNACGARTLEREDPGGLAVSTRQGTDRHGGHYFLQVAIAGLEINGQPVDSENVAELIASNLEEVLKGK